MEQQSSQPINQTVLWSLVIVAVVVIALGALVLHMFGLDISGGMF
ncbi:MAG: hypothetical protein ABIE70_06485 [bacterium]